MSHHTFDPAYKTPVPEALKHHDLLLPVDKITWYDTITIMDSIGSSSSIPRLSVVACQYADRNKRHSLLSPSLNNQGRRFS